MDLTTVNTIWRPVYGDLVRAVALLTPEWSQLKSLTNFDMLSPRAINWPVELDHGGGIAATENGGSTARATTTSPVEATDTWKYFTGRFEVGFDELLAENQGRFSKQQIEKQLRFQAGQKLRAFRKAFAINFYGHNTGVLFLVNDGTPDDTITVDSLYGEDGLTPDRIRDYLQAGEDTLAFINPADDSERGRALVSSIDESTSTITLDSDPGAADNDYVVLANQVITDEGSDHDRWMNGFLDLYRATTLHDISSSDKPDWAPAVDEASYGAALSGKDAYKWFEEISQRSGHDVEWGYTTNGVIAEAGGAELDQRRYGDDQDTMRMGFNRLNMMGVVLEGRPYVPDGYLFLGSNTVLRKLSPDESSDPQNVVTSGDRAGSFQQYNDRLGFYKDQVIRSNLVCINRLGLGVVDGITEA
jgi:hypothetical protein